MAEDRFQILRREITKSQKIIEIGPCHNPIAPKRNGWNAFSIDHTDQSGLFKKYQNDPTVDPNLIEPVDFIWGDGSLSDAVPIEHRGSFDVFLASHVIEHTTDLVAFLSTAEILLKSNGRVILAIPDKRACFDYYRPISTTGDVLEAWHLKRTRHSKRTAWDYASYTALKHGHPGWLRSDQAPAQLTCTFPKSVDFDEEKASNPYRDAHKWVFVPASFELILLELARLGLTDWQLEHHYVADATEFFVWLGRDGKAKASTLTDQELAQERHRLLEAIMLQLDEQSLQMPMSIASQLSLQIQELRQQMDKLLKLQAAATGAIATDAATQLVADMRATRTWKIRTRFRRLLGLPQTIADR